MGDQLKTTRRRFLTGVATAAMVPGTPVQIVKAGPTTLIIPLAVHRKLREWAGYDGWVWREVIDGA